MSRIDPDMVNAIIRDPDSPLYPSQISVFCDGCQTVHTADYMVSTQMSRNERLEVARAHLRGTEGWKCDDAGDFCPACIPTAPPGEHRPTVVHFGDEHSIPAEVCGTCSDTDAGRWVPVTQCPTAAAQMTDGPSHLYADVLHVQQGTPEGSR